MPLEGKRNLGFNRIVIADPIALVQLNNEHRAIIDLEDLGLITPYHWLCLERKTDGRLYVAASIKGKYVMLSRLVTNVPNGFLVDHENHNTFDNRKVNLRIVTTKQNAENRKGATCVSETGIRGVGIDRSGGYRSYRVQVVHNGNHFSKCFPYTEAGLKDAETCAISKRKELFTHTRN